MKNSKKMLMLSFIISIFMASNVFAGQWDSDRFGWSYYDNGVFSITRGWKEINSCWYYFNEEGYIQKGWFHDNGNWYYLSEESGIMLSDSLTPDGHYVDSTGAWNTNASYRLSSEKSPIYSYLPQLEENNGYYKSIDLNGYWVNDVYSLQPASWIYKMTADKGDYLEIDGGAFSPEYLSAVLSHDEETLSSFSKSDKYIYTGSICIKKNAVFKIMMTESGVNNQDFDWTSEGYAHLTSIPAEEFLRSGIHLGFCKMKFDQNGYVIEVIDLYDV